MRKLLLAIPMVVGLLGCSEDNQAKPIPIIDPEPIRQVNLSFDDGVSLDSIYKHLWLFKRYDAHITYYMSHYNSPTTDKTQALALQEAGHEIGHHGTWHQNAINYTAEHGIDKYIADEVMASLVNMQADGLNVTSFAYPFGAYTEETDVALLEIFDSVRYFESAEVDYVVSGGNKILAYSIDSHRINLNKIFDAMDSLEDGDTLYLATHVIGEWENVWHITTQDLEAILDYGNSTNITFCTVRECNE